MIPVDCAVVYNYMNKDRRDNDLMRHRNIDGSTC